MRNMATPIATPSLRLGCPGLLGPNVFRVRQGLPEWLAPPKCPRLARVRISSLNIAAAFTAPSHICITSLWLPPLPVASFRPKRHAVAHSQSLQLSLTHYTSCEVIWLLTVAPTLSTERIIIFELISSFLLTTRTRVAKNKPRKDIACPAEGSGTPTFENLEQLRLAQRIQRHRYQSQALKQKPCANTSSPSQSDQHIAHAHHCANPFDQRSRSQPHTDTLPYLDHRATLRTLASTCAPQHSSRWP